MITNTSEVSIAVAISSLILSMNAIGAAPAGRLPATLRQGEVVYLSGGIGLTEANAIKHAAKSYPLELEFLAKAKQKAEYLADVKVQIKDARDKIIFDATSEGPFLLAKMPVGKYTVIADHDGKVEHRKIEIAAKEHRRVVFEWQS